MRNSRFIRLLALADFLDKHQLYKEANSIGKVVEGQSFLPDIEEVSMVDAIDVLGVSTLELIQGEVEGIKDVEQAKKVVLKHVLDSNISSLYKEKIIRRVRMIRDFNDFLNFLTLNLNRMRGGRQKGVDEIEELKKEVLLAPEVEKVEEPSIPEEQKKIEEKPLSEQFHITQIPLEEPKEQQEVGEEEVQKNIEKLIEDMALLAEEEKGKEKGKSIDELLEDIIRPKEERDKLLEMKFRKEEDELREMGEMGASPMEMAMIKNLVGVKGPRVYTIVPYVIDETTKELRPVHSATRYEIQKESMSNRIKELASLDKYNSFKVLSPYEESLFYSKKEPGKLKVRFSITWYDKKGDKIKKIKPKETIVIVTNPIRKVSPPFRKVSPPTRPSGELPEGYNRTPEKNLGVTQRTW